MPEWAILRTQHTAEPLTQGFGPLRFGNVPQRSHERRVGAGGPSAQFGRTGLRLLGLVLSIQLVGCFFIGRRR